MNRVEDEPYGGLPLVTVILPVRNEEASIELSLGSVLEQDYPAERLEVLVVDGGSTDATRDLAVSLGKRSGTPVRVLDNPGLTAASALNIGVANSRGDVVLRVDGHCEIGPGHARTAVAALRECSVGCVGGPIETISVGMIGGAVAAAMSSPFGVGGSTFRVGVKAACDVDTVPFPAFRRSILQRLGPFDEELVRNQDDEYSYRLRSQGFRVRLLPDLTSRYYSRSTLWSLWRQYFQYGFWKIRVLQKHPRQMKARQFTPAVLATALVASFAYALAGAPIALTSLIVIYGLAAGVAALRSEVAGSSWRITGVLPVAYAAMHLGYGFGFLAGLGRFWNRWGDRDPGGSRSD